MIMAFTPKEKALRREYSKVSRRIRQQLKRLTVQYPENTIETWIRGEFPTLKELGNISNKGLQMITARAQGLYKSKLLTIPGYEASLVKSAMTLQNDGYDWVLPDNMEKIWGFVDEMRARGLADIYGYRAIIDVYNRIMIDKTISADELRMTFEDWFEYAQEYSKQKEAAEAAGRKAPRARMLRFVRKPRKKKSSSNDYNA